MTTSTESASNQPTIQAKVIAPIAGSSCTITLTKSDTSRRVFSSKTQGSASLRYSPKEFRPDTASTSA